LNVKKNIHSSSEISKPIFFSPFFKKKTNNYKTSLHKFADLLFEYTVFRRLATTNFRFRTEKCILSAIRHQGAPMTTTKSIDSYRLTDLEEPTDEMLAQIMREAAEDARKANADATKRFFDEIEKMCENVRFP
jgi:hypothetical protein